jgi:HK97 gp10 family phage protein
MARFDFEIPDDFLKGLQLTDELANEMIDSALPIYQRAIQRRLIIHKRTGALINSVKVKKAKKARNGAYIGNVTFDGKDKNGTSNALKAGVLENGRSDMPAQPFMQAAQNDCKQEVLDKMQEVYNERVMGR